MHKVLKGTVLFGVIPVVMAFGMVLFHPSAARWNPPELADGEKRLEELLDESSAVIWIHARDYVQFERGTIPGAISLNHSNFEEQLPLVLEAWIPGTRLVVFCDATQCDVSHEIAGRLRQEVGLPDVWVLYGGWSAWQQGILR